MRRHRHRKRRAPRRSLRQAGARNLDALVPFAIYAISFLVIMSAYLKPHWYLP
ncbi:hypothetical protein ACIP88_05760 [Streptomyces uncialis]|uniref:hypothetical protein n=1 Tax=Streptomyces uncialis TaxID=1048205 RepID=UPI00380B7853